MVRKVVHHIHKLPSTMGKAVGQNRFHFGRQVPRQGVAHLDRRTESLDAFRQDLREVLTSMLAAAEEQGDLVTFAGGPDSRGEQASTNWFLLFARALFGNLGQGGLPSTLAHPLQNLDGCVVIVEHLPLSRLPDQFGVGRQGNPQTPLQTFRAVERTPRPHFWIPTPSLKPTPNILKLHRQSAFLPRARQSSSPNPCLESQQYQTRQEDSCTLAGRTHCFP